MAIVDLDGLSPEQQDDYWFRDVGERMGRWATQTVVFLTDAARPETEGLARAELARREALEA